MEEHSIIEMAKAYSSRQRNFPTCKDKGVENQITYNVQNLEMPTQT